MSLEQALQAVETVMAAVVNSDIPVLRDASHHILDAGGKRIRPRIVMLSYAAAGGSDTAYAAPVAAAVELVHTASVVHDDINDHGVVRRGRPSINVQWGRTFALLTGDFLFTKVYELMAPYKDLNVTLAEATVALVEGETLQAHAAKTGTLNREIYAQIIARKTAALFRAGARLGAELAGAPAEQVAALGEYGFNLGMAFQITDDILDLVADAELLGKTAGIDLAQGKGLGTVYAANGGSLTDAEALAFVLDEDDKAASDDPLTDLKRRILQGSAIEEGSVQARAFVQQAVASLAALPPSAARDALAETAHAVINRSY
ncbi:MAG: octaprenyl diphosphate synthase [Chloroflexota bacterium]|nr:MAG: octaprenyl diphosphate synthase [Chloroflexota bacterium]